MPPNATAGACIRGKFVTRRRAPAGCAPASRRGAKKKGGPTGPPLVVSCAWDQAAPVALFTSTVTPGLMVELSAIFFM